MNLHRTHDPPPHLVDHSSIELYQTGPGHHLVPGLLPTGHAPHSYDGQAAIGQPGEGGLVSQVGMDGPDR